MPETSVEDGTQAKARHPLDGNFEAFLSRIRSPALQAVARSWHLARGNKRLSSWTDVAPSILAPYSRQLWCWAYDPATGEFTGRSAAASIGKWVKEDVRGRPLKDLLPPASRQEAQQLLTRIVTTPLASRSSGRLFTTGGIAVTGERIALPLAEDGKTVDGVLGASDYEPPPLLGSFELVHENLEWYAI